jgi:hypothetical protein
LRKASPPITETTTVVTMTIRPSTATGETAPDVAHRLLLEEVVEPVSETPRIGKVSPPCGPWKDRIAMVIVGP